MDLNYCLPLKKCSSDQEKDIKDEDKILKVFSAKGKEVKKYAGYANLPSDSCNSFCLRLIKHRQKQGQTMLEPFEIMDDDDDKMKLTSYNSFKQYILLSFLSVL